VQQGENKGRWKSTEQANNPEFSFFLNFSLIFPKGTSRNQTFLFFYYFFIFLWTRLKKEATTKIGTYNWGGMWSTEIQHVLWKACKNMDIFFFVFLNLFGNFDETKQGEAICCWAWVTVARWTCADKRICGAIGGHTIWQQGLIINECRLAIVQSGSKVQITTAG
jgi:hypothetical protein